MKHVPKCRCLLLILVVIVVLVHTGLTTTTNTNTMMTLAFTVQVAKPMRTTRTIPTTTASITTGSRTPILDKQHQQQQYQSVTQQSFLHIVTSVNNDNDGGGDDNIDSGNNNNTPDNDVLIEKNNDTDASTTTTNNSKLDTVLSKLTTMFPVFVLCAAIIGIIQPHYLLWINNGSIISYMLALVMCGTGLTLQLSDFTTIIQSSKNLSSIPLGILCQFCIMPLTSFIIGLFLLYYPYSLSSSLVPSYGYDLFIGLILVGCAPGGTASNLVTLIANANVALSVLLTTCSTILAVVVTPFLITLSVSLLQKIISFQSTTAAAKALSSTTKSIARTASTSSSSSNLPIQISGSTLCMATAKVVFIPIVLGMIVRGQFPFLATFISRFTPFASVLLVSLLCGGVVAQNVQMLQSTTTAICSSSIIQSILLSVLLVHTIGFITGYIIPKFGFQQNESTSRTISIEVGMQNSALAVVLAKSIPGLHPIATLPGAFSATVHSCLGSILATIWRRRSNNNKSVNETKIKTK